VSKSLSLKLQGNHKGVQPTI